jgi:tetratricopeptide (TPR) repeat protein
MLSRALSSLAAIQLEEEAAEAIGTLREAITAAAAAHDDRLVAVLWAKLLSVLAVQRRGRDAETLIPAAEAAVARTAARLDLNVAFLDSKSQVASVNGDVAHAQQFVAEAVRVLEEAGADKPGSPLAPQLLTIRTRSASTYAAADDWPRMATETRALIPLANALYGPDHPTVMRIHFNLAIALRHVSDDKGALVEFREAARIGESRLAASPGLADLLYGVGSTLVAMQLTDEALPYLERAVAMSRATMPENDRRLANQYNALGSAFIDKRRWAEALDLFEKQLAIYEKLEHEEVNLAATYYNIGRVGVESKHCGQHSFEALERALAIYEKISAKDRYDVDTTYIVMAECHLTNGKWAAAMEVSDRLLRSTVTSPTTRALARFAHGRALVSSGKAREGRAELTVTRKELVDLEATSSVAELDKFLAHH